MARIKLVPDIPPINNWIQNSPEPIVEDLSMVAKYAFRAKIISDRYNRGFEASDVQGPKDAFETSGLSIFQTEKTLREKQINESREKGIRSVSMQDGSYTFEPAKDPSLITNRVTDTITIIDYDFGSDKGKRGYSYITLPFVPRDLSYEPTSKFVGIATMGRNNPHYHFTGSEDTLQFDIDWFSNQDDRKDVINNCRWIEALTKGDGYEEPPHRVKLVWSVSDLLFADTQWLVVAAPYTLSDFVKAYRDPKSKEIVKVGMLPQQAYQKITLKRVTSNNRRSVDILGRLK